MLDSVFWGVVAALSLGTADYLARTTSNAVGPFAAFTFVVMLGTLLMAAFMVVTGTLCWSSRARPLPPKWGRPAWHLLEGPQVRPSCLPHLPVACSGYRPTKRGHPAAGGPGHPRYRWLHRLACRGIDALSRHDGRRWIDVRFHHDPSGKDLCPRARRDLAVVFDSSLLRRGRVARAELMTRTCRRGVCLPRVISADVLWPQ